MLSPISSTHSHNAPAVGIPHAVGVLGQHLELALDPPGAGVNYLERVEDIRVVRHWPVKTELPLLRVSLCGG